MSKDRAAIETAAKPAATEEKAGYKTTEFWLSAIAAILGIVLASGAIPDGGTAGQIIGGALSLLGTLGYTASRTQVKKSK